MAESRLEFRKRHVDDRLVQGRFAFPTRDVGVPSLTQPQVKSVSHDGGDLVVDCLSESRHGHSISFSGGVGELATEPIALSLLRGSSGSASGSSMLPGLQHSRLLPREGFGGKATGNQWNADFTPNALSDNPGSCNIATYEQSHDQSFQEEGHDHVSWNNSLGHRRVHSAPNIMEHMSRDCPGLSSPRWRDPSLPLPWLSSDLLKAGIRESAIPEGRRFEALEPPLRSGLSAPPGRPRSWRVRTTAPPWGLGGSVNGLASTLSSTEHRSLEGIPKLRASYFVDVRSPREGETNPAPAVRGIISDTSTIGTMGADTRPFEEIKRMRLSQALDNVPPDGGGLAIAPSPTFATCIRAHFDLGRTTPRFSPGKGVKVSGFTTPAANGRSTFGGGVPRDIGFGRQPLSPALTAPPTPPPTRPDWKAQDAEPYPFTQPRAAEADQGVLPMEQRPLDEVNAVQALMSVGRGARAQSTPMSVPEEEIDSNGIDTDSQAGMQALEVSKNAVPSLERLKSFDKSLDCGEEEDDGLDKDLWVVVEKGSLCAADDCLYRDLAARIASRRHYHSKCNHTHHGGVKKGMVFHHHQLEKVQKHQRSHQREATKSAPYKRTTPEDHQAMEGAGVEGYRPEDWEPEETRRLDELVNQLVAPVTHAWPNIARFFPTKSSIQCLLHWRFTLNDNGIIRGNGTWGAEEDARLRKLAPVFSSPATGPRWAKIAEVMPGRTAKQCRERYNNHVDPAIKKDKIWTAEEDALVMQLHAEHHNQFAKIARHIPGRCYDDVKNRFNLLVKRRQCAGRANNPGSPATASPDGACAGASGPTGERITQTERPVSSSQPVSPPVSPDKNPPGQRATPDSDHDQQAKSTSRSGAKRLTSETLGNRGPVF